MDSKNFALEKFAGWEDAFGDGGADCEHWLVHDLAQAEVQGDAAKEISVDVEEAPARDEEIDHAIGGSAGSGDGVGGGLDYDPGFVERVLRKRWGGFDQRSGD